MKSGRALLTSVIETFAVITLIPAEGIFTLAVAVEAD